MEQVTTLQMLIDWVIRIGASLAAFELTARFSWPANPEIRRYFSFLVAALIGLAAWGVGIEFGYIVSPGADWHRVVEGAAGVVLSIMLGAQVIHARVILSQKA